MVVTAGQGLRTGFCTLTDGHWKLPVVVSSWTTTNQDTSVAISEGEKLTMIGTVHIDSKCYPVVFILRNGLLT